jgi:hypothetical protein
MLLTNIVYRRVLDGSFLTNSHTKLFKIKSILKMKWNDSIFDGLFRFTHAKTALWERDENPELCPKTFLIVSIKHAKHMSNPQSTDDCC